MCSFHLNLIAAYNSKPFPGITSINTHMNYKAKKSQNLHIKGHIHGGKRIILVTYHMGQFLLSGKLKADRLDNLHMHLARFVNIQSYGHPGIPPHPPLQTKLFHPPEDDYIMT